jgi:hypothetical protein
VLFTNEILICLKIKVQEKQTSPPDYLTESELISLMEKHGIGTDASIPVHINNICERNYVKLERDRRLVPTNLGNVNESYNVKSISNSILLLLRHSSCAWLFENRSGIMFSQDAFSSRDSAKLDCTW